MPYSELIKNFENIRSYVREFYVYGFKSRSEYSEKSGRSYDNERRRIESYFSEFVSANRTSDGKNIFISIDSRETRKNPLYRALRSKSFTDREITLHFILFDILASPDIALTSRDITDKITDSYLSGFDDPKYFDESTVRKKLAEYVSEGLIVKEKHGRTVVYRRADDIEISLGSALSFFSEVSPCGVAGDFIADSQDSAVSPFGFKHHYIAGVLDSEILCSLFMAMHDKCEIEIEKISVRKNINTTLIAVPLCVYISVQSGRQYLMAYRRENDSIISVRIDYIASVKKLSAAPDFNDLRRKFDTVKKHIWGVSLRGGGIEKVSFTVRCSENEPYIVTRLMREKRCGVIEKIDSEHYRFTAEVYDTNEMITWIRTFIGRITHIEFSNKELQARFLSDMKRTSEMYEDRGE